MGGDSHLLEKAIEMINLTIFMEVRLICNKILK